MITPSLQPQTRLNLSPPLKITSLKIPRGTLSVVRDDELPGGTKQRALLPYLESLKIQNYTEFVYASPFCGFAQVALALTCKILNLKTRIFCERDLQGGLHEFAALAQSYGARVTLHRDLEECESLAQEYGQEKAQRFKLPLGLKDPIFKDHLKSQIKAHFQNMDLNFNRLWLPVGSGTLAEIFRDLLGPEKEIIGVNVRVLPQSDPRLRNLEKNLNIPLIHCNQTFHEEAQHLPPIPSNLHYDAKLWDFLQTHGEDNDLWWNVAR